MGLKEWIWQQKYRIVFLRREHKAVFVKKVKILKSIKALQKENEKQFLIDINSPVYINQNVFTYLVDYDSGKQMTLNEQERQMSPDELDLIVGSKIIKELTSGVINNSKEKILWAIIGLVLGALIAVAIMQSVMAGKLADLREELTNTLPTIPTIGSVMKGMIFGG